MSSGPRALLREWTMDKTLSIDWYNADDVMAHKFSFLDMLNFHSKVSGAVNDRVKTGATTMRQLAEDWRQNPRGLITQWQTANLLMRTDKRWCRNCGREGHTLGSCGLGKREALRGVTLEEEQKMPSVLECLADQRARFEERVSAAEAKAAEREKELLRRPRKEIQAAADVSKRPAFTRDTRQGVITTVSHERMYGMVQDPTGTHFFSIYRASGYGLKNIQVGDRVTFTLETNVAGPGVASANRGPRAVDVTPLAPTLQRSDVEWYLRRCRESKDTVTCMCQIILYPHHWKQLLAVIGTLPARTASDEKPEAVRCHQAMSLVRMLSYVENTNNLNEGVLEHFLRHEIRMGVNSNKGNNTANNTSFESMFPAVFDWTVHSPNTELNLGDTLALARLLVLLRRFVPVAMLSNDKILNVAAALKERSQRFANDARFQDAVLQIERALAQYGADDKAITPLLPTFEELSQSPSTKGTPLHCRSLPQLKSTFKDATTHLNAHYSLLRADCYTQLVKNIHEGMLKVKQEKNKDKDEPDEKPVETENLQCLVYHGIEYVGEYADIQRGVVPVIHFTPHPKRMPSYCFTVGALLFFATKAPETEGKFSPGEVFFARCVAVTNDGLMAIEAADGDTGSVEVLVKNLKRNRHMGMEVALNNSLMMLSPSFFPGYEPVLSAMRAFLHDASSFPFKAEIVDAQFKNKAVEFVPPKYRPAYAQLVQQMRRALTLDAGQDKAMSELDSRGVLLVQGPPGTGKSFLGCRCVEAVTSFRIRLHNGLLENMVDVTCDMDFTEHHIAPVLVVTYKNHALDEFLSDVLDTGIWCNGARDLGGCKCSGKLAGCCPKCCTHKKNVVRLGSRLENPRLMPYTLGYRLEKATKATSYFEYKKRLQALRRRMRTLLESVDQFEKGKLPESVFMQYLTEDQKTFFNFEQHYKDWISIDSSDKTTVHFKTLICPTFRGNTLSSEELEDDEDDVDIPQATVVTADNAADTVKTNNFSDMKDELEVKHALRQQFMCSAEAIELAAMAPLETPRIDGILDLKGIADRQERHNFVYEILRHQIQSRMAQYTALCAEHLHLSKLTTLTRRSVILGCLKSADVVAATTTGCAMHIDVIRALAPSVLVVEEAAEILESQLLSCMTPSLKQIILIGDHQQLHPGVETYELQKYNNLNHSMFERLTKTIPLIMLKEQRRMKPAICNLVRPFYNDNGVELQDHMSVHKKKLRLRDGQEWDRVYGLPNLVQFWDHSCPETRSDAGVSLTNKDEVAMATYLCGFLLFQGVSPSSITIITPYLGQRREIRNGLKRSGDKLLMGINVCTVDRYQGDENDIIILSLTRTSKLTEFLKLENRMIVACSRARHALVILGNAELLRGATHWKKVLDTIGAENISQTMKLSCVRHPEHKFVVDVPAAKEAVVEMVATGRQGLFCQSECGYATCKRGHHCRRQCHDDSHPAHLTGTNCPTCLKD
eukprot:PhM_4_TR8054/c0_g1_i1/m.30623